MSEAGYTRQPNPFFFLLCVSFSVFSVPLWFVPPAHAQLPHIRLDRILPLGGAAGSDVLLQIAGKDLDEVTALHFDHPGFKAELVKHGLDPAPGTREELANYMTRESEKWGKVVREAKITLE